MDFKNHKFDLRIVKWSGKLYDKNNHIIYKNIILC